MLRTSGVLQEVMTIRLREFMPYGLLLAKVVELVCVGRRCALPLESQAREARLDVGGKTPASKPAHTYEVVSLWKEPVMTVITFCFKKSA